MHSTTLLEPKCSLPEFHVLGVRVSAVEISDVVRQMEQWIQMREGSQYIAVTGMHGVMEAQKDPRFKVILNAAGLVVPDGMPLVWLARQHDIPLEHRVSGAELMEAFCQHTGSTYRHFLYGGAPGVAKELAKIMELRFGSRVVGTYCPPFRPVNGEEKQEIVALIRSARPDILWVGLSTPKQERWMFEYRELLEVPVLLGVGAAFDFHTGRSQRAPEWMRERGLEWSYRLMKEPRRLWRRYLILGSQFAARASWEIIKERNKPN